MPIPTSHTSMHSVPSEVSQGVTGVAKRARSVRLAADVEKNVHGVTHALKNMEETRLIFAACHWIPAQGHGFENLVVATPPPRFTCLTLASLGPAQFLSVDFLFFLVTDGSPIKAPEPKKRVATPPPQ